MAQRRAGLLASAEEIAGLIARLGSEDAGSIPLLDEAERCQLIEAAKPLPFRRANSMVGEGERAVWQDFDVCTTIPSDNSLWDFAFGVDALLKEAQARLDPSPVPKSFCVNDLILQRYAPGSRGITPHRDHLCYEGVIAIVTLSGSARFFVCADRSGMGADEVDMPAGSLLLMRASGFAGRRDRPFHFVRDVSDERISLGLRHDVRAR